jgi:endonuclease/exonuclease/phosphatase family metal-dependent hydrolase
MTGSTRSPANARAEPCDKSLMRCVLLMLLGACASIDDTPQPWVAAADIAAPLAAEFGPPPAPREVPATLRIASWNVERGADPDALADEIRSSPFLATADILFVQEIESHPNEAASRASHLARALDMTWFYAPSREQDSGTHGLALLSRFVLLAPEVKQLPFVDQPVNARPRIAQRAAVVLGDRTLTLVNVHLDTRLAVTDRIRQLDPAIADSPHDALVGGDLNTLPWQWVETSVPLMSTEAVVGLEQAKIVDDYLRALGFATPIEPSADTHASLFDLRLDALCPRGFAVVDAGVDTTVAGSDHFAIWIDLAVR